MARLGELTDKAWERIAPLLPVAAGPGRPWRGHRQVLNGILWRLETGSTWREIPERYGPWQTCYERFKRWNEDGTWARVMEEAQVRDDLEQMPSPSSTPSSPRSTHTPQKEEDPGDNQPTPPPPPQKVRRKMLNPPPPEPSILATPSAQTKHHQYVEPVPLSIH